MLTEPFSQTDAPGCRTIKLPEMAFANVVHTEDFNASDLEHHLRRVDLAHVAPLVLLSHTQDAQRPSSVGQEHI